MKLQAKLESNPQSAAQRAQPTTRLAGTVALTALLALTIFTALNPLPAHAACPSVATATRFTFSSDGAQVTDNQTGLVWARCAAGQTWSANSCSGTAGAYTQEDALSYAQSQSGWRLPNIKELASLVDAGCYNPAIDATAFPNTPAMLFWSATPFANNSAKGLTVDFYYGGVGNNPRTGSFNAFPVRLVRASP